MKLVQKPSDPECYTPSSEPFGFQHDTGFSGFTKPIQVSDEVLFQNVM
jgi:hypothetical protein